MDQPQTISFRERIRLNLIASMKQAGISQVQLAEKLGISKGTVNNWVRGNNSPDVDMVPRICAELGISILTLYSPLPFEQDNASPNKKSPSPEDSEPRDKYAANFMRCVALLTDDQKDFLLAVLEEYVERNRKSRSAAQEAVEGTVQKFEHHDQT